MSEEKLFVTRPYVCFLPNLNLNGSTLRMLVLLCGLMDGINTINITQKELGKIMSLSQLSVAKCIKTLKDAGLIKQGRGRIGVNPKYAIKPDASIDLARTVYNYG